jgi:hypothetical protein
LKGLKRAREKTKLEYNGDARRLKDMLRGSVFCNSLVEVVRVVQALQDICRNSDMIKVVQIKNRFQTGKAHSSGYRDMNITISYEGFLCELQVHSIHHYLLKQYQHPVYELCRSFKLVGSLPEEMQSRIVSRYGSLAAGSLHAVPRATAKGKSMAVLLLRAVTGSWAMIQVQNEHTRHSQ